MGMVSSAISSYKFSLLSSAVSAQVACVAIHRPSCSHLTSILYGCDGQMRQNVLSAMQNAYRNGSLDKWNQNFSAFSLPYSSNFLSSSHTHYFLLPTCVIYTPFAIPNEFRPLKDYCMLDSSRML